MNQRNWFKIVIGFMAGTMLVAGCARTGPTPAGTKPMVQSENPYDPARGLDPNSPSFWQDYGRIYSPK